jgi:diacylglycerol kinase
MIKEIESFLAAIRGILFAIKNEKHFKFHIIAAIIVLWAGFYFQITAMQWIAIFICIALVTTTEIINTSIEKLTDMVSPQYNRQAGIVKDLAAGGVLLTALISVIVGCIIFIPIIFPST